MSNQIFYDNACDIKDKNSEHTIAHVPMTKKRFPLNISNVGNTNLAVHGKNGTNL